MSAYIHADEECLVTESARRLWMNRALLVDQVGGVALARLTPGDPQIFARRRPWSALDGHVHS